MSGVILGKSSVSNTSGNVINPATEEKQDDNITLLQSIETLNKPVVDTPEFFEDTNFVTGDSPVILDINTALGRNVTSIQIENDGPGDFTMSSSTDGIFFGDEITMKAGEIQHFDGVSVDSLRITWVADSAYRVTVI